MTPKEKALDLYNLFLKHSYVWDCYNDEPVEYNHAKAAAIICTHEIEAWSGQDGYWNDVRKEIENLFNG